jgi:2-polyprenyl-6-methoxyphenol hydroxylase-like FAD-dependent oxidoreductase
MKSDFVVSGGGIGGAVLAELLARAGKRVVVLEKNLRAPTWTRPEIFWPVTADFLATLITRDVFAPIDAFDIHDGRRVDELVPAEALLEARVRPSSADPNVVRELLLERATFEVKRGVEVVSLLREDERGEALRIGGVRAREVDTGREFDVSAAWTIGDDGVRSAVREGCAIGVDLRMFPVDFLCFGPLWPEGLSPSRVRLWANRGRTRSGILGLGAVPLPGGRGTGLVLALPRAFEDPRAAEDWQRFLAGDPLLAAIVGDRSFPGDFTRVRRPWGHAERYGVDGALLLGDAAHPVSPAGGQGASMAVADARALAEILLSGEPDPVATFERRRRAANARSLAITRLVHRIWSVPRWCRSTPLFFAALAFLRSHPSVLARAVRNVSTRFLEDPPETP